MYRKGFRAYTVGEYAMTQDEWRDVKMLYGLDIISLSYGTFWWRLAISTASIVWLQIGVTLHRFMVNMLRSVYSDTTQLNSTSSWVELCHYKRALSGIICVYQSTFLYRQINKKLRYRKQIARQQCTQSNDSTFSVGKFLTTDEACGTSVMAATADSINFSGIVFTDKKNLWHLWRRSLRGRFHRKWRNLYIRATPSVRQPLCQLT